MPANLVVALSPMIYFYSRLVQRYEPVRAQYSLRNLPLRLSTNASEWVHGCIKSSVIPVSFGKKNIALWWLPLF